MTNLEKFIDAKISAYLRINESVETLNRWIKDLDYDNLTPILTSVVEPDILQLMLDDPEVNKYVDSFSTGLLTELEFINQHDITTDQAKIIASFLDEYGY